MDSRHDRKKKSNRGTWVLFFLLFCFFAAAAAGALLASSGLFDSDPKTQVIKNSDRENNETQLIKAKDKTTVLILGVDVRKDDVGRSDTMMIATIDPKLDQASLLSVPRDTRVRIKGYGFDKINAAFAYGGEPLAEKTVENFLGIDIDHYIIINTKSFVKIIDAIGGLDIDVEKRMYYEDPWDDDGGLYIDLYPGMQHMDGETAVTYVRYRDEEGDIGRIKRQQKFMAACLDKIISPDIVTRIPAVVREVTEAIDTDMTFRQLLEIAGALKAAQQNGLQADMVPGYPLYIDGISYWIPDVEELRFAFAEGLGISVDSDLKKRARDTASEYSQSIPSNAKEIPEGEESIGKPIRSSERNYTDRYSDNYNSSSRSERNSTPQYNERTSTDYDSRATRSDYDRNSDSRNYRYTEPQIEQQNYSDTNNYYDNAFDETPSRGNSIRN